MTEAPPIDEMVDEASPVVETPTFTMVTLPVTSRRRLVESAVLFVSAILFIRTVAVEPFGVPTGSMAPMLSGNHRSAACSRCSYPVTVGEPSHKPNGFPDASCPNCGAVISGIGAAPDIVGDRLLVDKNVFRIRSPRRWEVAVFICPSDKSKPYVKRVVGRPGERIQINQGDVWINDALERKTLAQARECRVPVFSGDHAPSAGWQRRWLVEGTQPALTNEEPTPLPEWATLDGVDLRLHGEGTTDPRVLAYWNVSLETLEADVIRDTFEYNGFSNPAHPEPVHDFYLECEVEVVAGQGEVLLKLTDGADEATARLAAGGGQSDSQLFVGKTAVATAVQPPLKVGEKYRVEMAFVDRRLSVAVNGKPYFTHDLPPAKRRNDVTSPFRIGVQGATVMVRHLRLFRDIHYRIKESDTGFAPFTLGPKEYFLLGDNTANSDDSRTWQIPAVPERNFLGKPFLLHQPSRPSHWDLGGRRFDTQGVDWSRIRWLR